MGDTKERILLTALELFSVNGYEAVSVSDIAAELGITKGALYRHYRSKRDIFESILARMEQRDAEQAGEHDLPQGTREEMADQYASAAAEDTAAFAKAMFRYWTEDGFAVRFRRMLTLEQFRSPEMEALYQQYLASGPVGYLRDLFDAGGLPSPEIRAAEFYGPMYLLYSVFDAAKDKAAVTAQLDALLGRALQRLTDTERMNDMENSDHILIRRETEGDHRAVESLIREAFWNVYRPGCLEHFVIHRLRDDPAFVPELDFVMEKDGVIIGQNMFMRAVIRADDGRDIPIMTMGPICVDPAIKRRGYGKRLLDYSLEKAAEMGCGALCFEGNIQFYGKSGFTAASDFGIRYHGLPEGADASFFLCRELIDGYLDGVTGEYAPPEGYFAAEREPEAFEAFDAQFPPREKKKLPGQLV